MIIKDVFVEHITYEDACILEVALTSHRNIIKEVRRLYPNADINEDRIAVVQTKILSILDGPRDRAIAQETVSYTSILKKHPLASYMDGYQGCPSWFTCNTNNGHELIDELHPLIFRRLKGGERISDHQRIYRTYDEAFADADKAYLEAVSAGEFNPVS
jgi:hypothetical protein